jgi:hypothetical protein
MPRYRRSGLVLAATLLGWSAPAAADTQVAVLGVEPIEVPQSLATPLTDALRQRAAGTAGVRSVAGKDLIEIKMIFTSDSESPSCMAQAGRTLGADKLLYGTIKRHGGKSSPTVVVALKLFDVRSATVEKFVNETVHKRDLTSANVNSAAARWFGALVEVQRPTLTVQSDPPGAQVLVDGQPMGRTPVTLRDLQAGTHSVALSLSGYMPSTRSIELRPGGSHEIVVEMEKERVAVAQPPPPPPKLRAPPPEPMVMPPQPIVAPEPPKAHPGRTARIVGFSTLGAAVVTSAVAIYTWRRYSDLEAQASRDLTAVQPSNQAESDFLHSPACNNIPASLDGKLGQYKNDCASGTNFANVTTALWVVTGALAAGGVAAIIVGERQAARARDEKKAGLGFRQRLKLQPVFSTQGGGLQAAFEF